MSQPTRRGAVAVVVALAMAGTGAVGTTSAAAAPPDGERRPAAAPKGARPAFTLTIAHNNDGESALTPSVIDGAEYGGVARFASVVERLRKSSTTGRPARASPRGAVSCC
jgi:5'-nucleotidase